MDRAVPILVFASAFVVLALGGFVWLVVKLVA